MSYSDVDVVILAGGKGTRFWPVSRSRKPKQFLSLEPNGESLIQATAHRVSSLGSGQHTWVVTNVEQIGLVREQLPTVSVLVEPEGRNTAASIGLAATYIAKRDPQRVMIVLPSDHVIRGNPQFLAVLERGIEVARTRKALVTLGVEPLGPVTAYGYIKRGREREPGVYEVARFFEKPSLERARQYLDAGDYYWNSGMFVWRAETILEAIAEYLPELADGLKEIGDAIGTPAETRVTKAVFQKLENVSVDIGILEHARNTEVVVAKGFSWSDVGAWDSWAALFPNDSAGNMTRGDVELLGSTDSIVVSEGRNVTLFGVEGMVVIDSGDALLICPRGRVQEVGKVVEHLRKKGRTDIL